MEHPITPPPELVQQWRESAPTARDAGATREAWIATQAARWGADAELAKCCKLLELTDSNVREFLYSARRPKPPSLAEQAMDRCNDYIDPDGIIRAALERLQELEKGNE